MNGHSVTQTQKFEQDVEDGEEILRKIRVYLKDKSDYCITSDGRVEKRVAYR